MSKKTKTKRPMRRLKRGEVTDNLSIYDGTTAIGTIVRFGADYCAFNLREELVGSFTDLKDAVQSLPKAKEAA
jgi:hypothetical protein